MNVSVVRKKFVFYNIYAFFEDDDEKRLIFCCLFDFIYFVFVCPTQCGVQPLYV